MSSQSLEKQPLHRRFCRVTAEFYRLRHKVTATLQGHPELPPGPPHVEQLSVLHTPLYHFTQLGCKFHQHETSVCGDFFFEGLFLRRIHREPDRDSVQRLAGRTSVRKLKHRA